LIKEVLARQLDPEIEAVRVVPTDKLPEPTPGDIPDELKAIEAALEGRPELEQGQLNLVNHDIAIGFTKNALLPTLDMFGLFSGAGLAGNRQIRAGGPGTPIIGEVEGGLTDALRRTFQFDFPTYAFGFSLQIPFRNRSAKADHARAVLDKRQAELRLQRLRSQIIQQVHNALVTLKQSRARMETSRKATQLAQQIFEAEQLRFQAGVSTPFLVIQAQRDLIAAQGSEQEAFNGYGKALVQLEMATGRLLERVGVDLEEAESGTVRTAPRFGK
jgi:outer membrane protein TolC